MSIKRWMVFVLTSLFWACAQAGIKVLDVELGVSTVEQVSKIASNAGKVQNAGTNSWTQGQVLLVQQGNYGIEGLQSVHYIFDASGKLACVLMTMGKNRFGEIFDLLAGKYKLVKQVRPFVGDQSAQFTAPDAIIDVSAPHMGFQMEVSYMTPAFVKAWQDGVRNQNQQKRSEEKAKL